MRKIITNIGIYKKELIQTKPKNDGIKNTNWTSFVVLNIRSLQTLHWQSKTQREFKKNSAPGLFQKEWRWGD